MDNIRIRDDEYSANGAGEPSYYTWASDDDKARQQAFDNYSVSVEEFSAVARDAGQFVGYNTNRSMRSSYHRGDYEYVRPNEATPWRSKDIIRKSIEICENVGRINDIFSLMADFSCQGISLHHQVPATEKLYQNWFKMVNGPERSERFCYYLLKQANVPVYRTYGKMKIKDIKKWKKEHSTVAAAATEVDGIKITKNRIPTKYKFMNIMTIEPEHGDDNPLYGLDINEKYYLKISKGIQELLTNPSLNISSRPINRLGVLSGESDKEELKKENFSVYFYKKDDWKAWADPILRPIFTNVATLRKMELADVSALDGIISSVRLWRLGDLDHNLLPNKALIAKLRNVLASNIGGGTLDLIWGPDIDFKDSSTDAHKFLGSDKYEPILDAIYSGIGVPPALRGQNSSGLGNNFISLQTFIERLQYIRSVLVSFWTNELKLVQAALGLPSLPKITFDKMVLGDESAEKQIIMNMVDRGIISEEAYVRYLGFSPDIENARLKRESKARDKGNKGPKASPFFNPQTDHELRKMFIQQGEVTPSEVGLELDDRKDGEKSKMDKMTETQLKLAKEKGVGSGNNKVPNGSKPSGDTGGRPKNAKDTVKRKERKISPQTKAFLNAYGWCNTAQQKISDIMIPKYLQQKKKKDLRSLTADERNEFEQMKAAALFSLPIYSEITPETVYNHLDQCNYTIDNKIAEQIDASVIDVLESTGKTATLEDIRDICAVIYSYMNQELIDGDD